MKTHIVAILDRSGSMGGKEREVVNAFNNFVEEQKKIPGKATLTLILFDDKYEVPIKKVKLKKAPALTEKQYYVRGMTALNDAVGKSISMFDKEKKVIVLIQTDGMENASQEWKTEKLKDEIQRRQKDGWEFVFIGAGIDAFAAGSMIGIDPNQIQNVTNDAEGIAVGAAMSSTYTSNYRTGK